MSTLTPSHNETSTVQSSRGFRIGDAMNDQAWIAKAAKQPMVLETVDLGPLGAEDVEVAVEYCGLCHSDLSVLKNDWGNSQYPAILGHEVVARVTDMGPNAKGLAVGQPVGVGWNSGSCMHCRQGTAGINQRGGSVGRLISTVNVKRDWAAMIGTPAPNGRLHVVGAVLEPIPVAAFSLILQQRSVSGSPTGSPTAIETMLDFASRHNVVPQTEHFPMRKINEAFARLESGKARYRIVLDADF